MAEQNHIGAPSHRVALVTGAGRGIGRVTARTLAARGDRVMAVARTESELRSLERETGIPYLVETVGTPDGCARIIEETTTRLGPIDILVNNAGLYASLPMRSFLEIPLDEWRTVMDVNVASMFLTCRAVVPVMQARGGGKIVNISSGTPFRGVPFLLHYVTSKGAIVAFTRALAKELGKTGVLVNCVAPGFTMSAGVEEHPEVVQALQQASVSSRTIQRDQVPEDVVGAVVYLCGPSSSFVTGQTIVIDGGQYFH
jgi:NAD(P)-dependent dehydrogenase (short-subunit alcohol dehydrogenase family)